MAFAFSTDRTCKQLRHSPKPGRNRTKPDLTKPVAENPAPAKPGSVLAPANPDAVLHSLIGRLTVGLSPAAIATAIWIGWCICWVTRQTGTAASPRYRQHRQVGHIAAGCRMGEHDEACLAEMQQDKRFSDPAWTRFPYIAYSRWFILQQQRWDAATKGLASVEPRHADIVSFATRQILDMRSPANTVMTKPAVTDRTRAELGRNLVRGFENYLEDLNRLISGKRALDPDFRVGETVATRRDR